MIYALSAGKILRGLGGMKLIVGNSVYEMRAEQKMKNGWDFYYFPRM